MIADRLKLQVDFDAIRTIARRRPEAQRRSSDRLRMSELRLRGREGRRRSLPVDDLSQMRIAPGGKVARKSGKI